MKIIKAAVLTLILLLCSVQPTADRGSRKIWSFEGLKTVISTNQLLELQQFQDQLLYYYPDIKQLANKTDGSLKEIVTRLSKIQKRDLQVLYQLEQAKNIGAKQLEDLLIDFTTDTLIIDQLNALQSENDTTGYTASISTLYKVEKQSRFNSFLLETDPFISIALHELSGCSAKKSQYLMAVAEILKAVATDTPKKKVFIQSLNDGSISFSDYLLGGFRQQWESDTSRWKANNGEQSIIGGEYNRVLLLLRFLAPELPEVLEGASSISCNLIEAYKKIKGENSRIALLNNFLKQYLQSIVVDLLFDNQTYKNKVVELLKEYNRLKNIPKSLLQAHGGEVNTELENRIGDEIRKYKRNTGGTLFQTRAKLLQEIDRVVLKLLSHYDKKSVLEASSYEAAGESNLLVEEVSMRTRRVATQVSTSEFNFADIKDKNDQGFWTRVRLSDETISRLKQDSLAKSCKIDLSVVYKPKSQVNDMEIEDVPEGVFEEFAKSEREVKEALQNVYTELKTGVTIHKVDVTQVDFDDAMFIVHLHDGSEIPVNLSMADTGIKTRLEYERSQFVNFVNDLQISKSLGFRLNDIGIDPLNWEPIFHFGWQKEGLIADMLRAENNLNEVKISIEEVNLALQGRDPRRAFQLRLVQKLANKLTDFVNDDKNTGVIKAAFLAERIDTIAFSSTRLVRKKENGIIVERLEATDELYGNASIYPVGASILGVTEPIHVDFKMALKANKPALVVTSTRLDIQKFVRERIEKELRPVFKGIDGALRNKQLSIGSFNILNLIQIENPEFDFLNKRICGSVAFAPNGNSFNTVFCITEHGIDFTHVDRLLRGVVTSFITQEFEELITDQFKRLAARALGAPVERLQELCNRLENDTIMLYDLTILVRRCEVRGTRIVADAVLESDPGINLIVYASLDGAINVEGLEGSMLREKLISKINTILPNNDYIKVENPRFENSSFLVDTRFEMSTLNIDIPLGTLGITPEGGISYEGRDDIKDEILGIIGGMAKAKLNKYLDNNTVVIEFGEASGLTVEKVTNFDLVNEKVMELSTLVEFPVPNGVLPIKLKVIFDIPSLTPRKIDLADMEEQILSSLGPFIKEFSFPDLGVAIDDITPKLNPIGIEGNLKITIAGLFVMPSTRFYLNKEGFDATLNPEFRIPGTIPIAPSLVIIDPVLKLDTEKKVLKGITRLTLGAASEATVTEQIIRVEAKINLSYDKFGDLDYRGDLIVASVVPMMQGEGKICLDSTYFEMNESTQGPLREIIEYDKQTIFNGEQKYAKGSASMNALGITSLEFNVSGNVIAGQFKVDGNGKGRIPLLEARMGGGTLMQPSKPVSAFRNAYAYLSGNFKVADFDISSFNVAANSKTANVSFEVLGAQLGLTTPTLDALDEGDIIDLILSMFDFDPLAIVDILKDLENVRLNNIDFGQVSLPQNFDLTGFGGGGEGERGSVDGDSEAGGEYGNELDGEAVDKRTQPRNDRLLYTKNLVISQVERDTTIYEKKCDGGWFGSGFQEDCKDVPRTKHLLKYPNWPSCFPCLPDDYKYYSCFYDIKASDPNTEYRIHDIILPVIIDGTHTRLESLKGYDFIFSAGEVDKVYGPVIKGDDQQRYLCLSDPNFDNSIEACFEVPQNFPAVDANYNTNIAYNDDGAYLFISYDLQNAKCSGKNTIENPQYFTLAEFKEELPSANEVRFNNVKVIDLHSEKPLPITVETRIIQNTRIGEAFIFNKGERDDSERVKEFSGGNKYFWNTIVNHQDIGRVSEGLEELEEWIFNEIFDRWSNYIADESLIVPVNNELVIVDNRSFISIIETYNASGYDVTNIKNILPKITEKVWKKIDLGRLQQVFPDIPSTNYREAFDYVEGNIMTDNSKRIVFDRFLQGLLKYGESPSMVSVAVSPYQFFVWDLSKISKDERWGFEYDFNTLNNTGNPYYLDTTSVYRKTKSHIIDTLGISSQDIVEHKEFLENSQDNASSIYTNYLFYSMLLEKRDSDNIREFGTLDNTALVQVNEREITFLKRDTIRGNNSYYRLITLSTGNLDVGKRTDGVPSTSLNPYVRDSSQLCFMGFNLNGFSIEELNSTIEDNRTFFDEIFRIIGNHQQSEVFVSRMPESSTSIEDAMPYRYRALIYDNSAPGQEWVRLFWESTKGVVTSSKLSIAKDMFDRNFKEALTGSGIGFEGKRVSSEGNLTDEEKAEIIFQGLDGPEVWFKGERFIINPLAIFNDNFAIPAEMTFENEN